MNRWAAVLAFAGVSAGALLVFPRVSGAPVSSDSPPSQPVSASREGHPGTAVEPGAVRVEHELVVVPFGSAVRAPDRPTARPVPAAPSARRTTKRAPETPPGLVMRVGRVLVGDGTHRPEPFPRIDAQK